MFRDTRLNVVLFPLAHCTIDFAQLTEQWLHENFGLGSNTEVRIIRKSATFVRIQCSSWKVKRYCLSWALRVAALQHFDVCVKEDLLRGERLQKRNMWVIMNALYSAYFYPRWNRTAVVWKANGKWFEVVPGEVPTGYTATQIVDYCNWKCGWEDTAAVACRQDSPTAAGTSLSTPESVVEQPAVAEVPEQQGIDAATQTQHTCATRLQTLHNSLPDMTQNGSTNTPRGGITRHGHTPIGHPPPANHGRPTEPSPIRRIGKATNRRIHIHSWATGTKNWDY